MFVILILLYMCGYLLEYIAGWLEVIVIIAKITNNYVMVHF